MPNSRPGKPDRSSQESDDLEAFFRGYQEIAARTSDDDLREHLAIWKLMRVLSQPLWTSFPIDEQPERDLPTLDLPEFAEDDSEGSEAESILDEKCLTLAEAAERLSERVGKRIYPSTVWRWATDGIRGLRLEVRRLGGSLLTSWEAIDRFSTLLDEKARQDRESREQPAPPKPAPSRVESRRKRRIDAARQRLDDAGI